jgi:hypothetical protein
MVVWLVCTEHYTAFRTLLEGAYIIIHTGLMRAQVFGLEDSVLAFV